MKHLKLLALVPLVALSGCAVNAYCEGERAYQTAQH